MIGLLDQPKLETYWVPIFDEEGECRCYTKVEYQDDCPVDYDREIEQYYAWEESIKMRYKDEFIEA